MKKLLLIAFLSVQAVFAQFTEFYCRTNGNNLNAGSVDSTSTTYAAAGGDWNSGTGVWTKVGENLSGVSVGMWASVHPDATTTVTPFVGVITAVDDTADTITVSLTSKSGTAPTTSTTDDVSIKVGGAWQGPVPTTGFPFGFVQNTMTNAGTASPVRINFKNDEAYEWETATTHANVGPIRWEGYTTSAGDGGKARFYGGGVASGTPFIMLDVTAAGQEIVNLHFDKNYLEPQAGAQSTGNFILQLSSQSHRLRGVRVSNGYRGGLRVDGSGSASATFVEESEFYNCQYDDANLFGNVDVDEESSFFRCTFYGAGDLLRSGAGGSQSSGVDLSNAAGEPVHFVECLFFNNQGDGVFFGASTANGRFERCEFYNNGLSGTGDGVDLSTVSQAAQNYAHFVSCNFVDNDDYGIRNDATATSYPTLINPGFYSNTTGQTNNINSAFVTGKIEYTGIPYVDAPNGDFRLNNTASAGALARGTGRGVIPINPAELSSGANTVSYPDNGAAQVQATGSSGTKVYIGR